MTHANQGLKSLKSHVVATPFIENEFNLCSEPRSGGTVSPLRGSDQFSWSFSINGGTTTWFLIPFLTLIRMTQVGKT